VTPGDRAGEGCVRSRATWRTVVRSGSWETERVASRSAGVSPASGTALPSLAGGPRMPASAPSAVVRSAAQREAAATRPAAVTAREAPALREAASGTALASLAGGSSDAGGTPALRTPTSLRAQRSNDGRVQDAPIVEGDCFAALAMTWPAVGSLHNSATKVPRPGWDHGLRVVCRWSVGWVVVRWGWWVA